MIPDKIDGLEVHKPLDVILEQKEPSLQLPPQAVATELLRDPILNALAENLQSIRDAEQLRTNQATLTIAVQQAAASQGISQDALERILHRVSEHHGEDLAQRLLARLGPGPPPPPAGAAERVSFGTSTGPMMQDAMVGGDGAVMRDRSVEARRPTMRDASVEGRPTMRDASIEARRPVMEARRPRSSSPEEMEVAGGGPPPPPPWMGSLLSRRTGTDARISRNPVDFVLPPPPPGGPGDPPPFGLPVPMFTGGLHRHHRRRRAGLPPPDNPGPPPNFGFAPTPVRQDVRPGEQLPIIVRMDDTPPPSPRRGMRAELRRRPLRVSNLTTAHEYAAKMAEAALRTARQARELQAADKRLEAARQLDALLSDQSMGTIIDRLDNPLVLHMAQQPSTQAVAVTSGSQPPPPPPGGAAAPMVAAMPALPAPMPALPPPPRTQSLGARPRPSRAPVVADRSRARPSARPSSPARPSAAPARPSAAPARPSAAPPAKSISQVEPEASSRESSMRGASVRSRSSRGGMSIPPLPAPPSSPVRAKVTPSKGDRSRSRSLEGDLYGQLHARLYDLYRKAGAPDLCNWRFRPPPEVRA